jgi:FkbM family methyltransferase
MMKTPPVPWAHVPDRKPPPWSIRTAAKASLQAMARRMPEGLRHALLRSLVIAQRDYDVFQALGRSNGVRDIRVEGIYGTIEGSISDSGVLRTYAVAKGWADQGNRIFIELFEHHGGGTYVDVGANIGLTTIPIAQNPAVACKVFEPAPANFRYLGRNLATNCPHANVEAFNLALFDRAATLEFELSEGNPGDGRIHFDHADGQLEEDARSTVFVKADRLDALLNRATLTAPLAVKIATQGAEAQVFAGGQALLAGAEVLAFEFWPYGIARAGGDVGFIADFIRSHFRSGVAIPGGRSEPPVWQQIGAFADTLLRFATNRREDPYSYYDAFVRKG